jgi:hypothetical protein
MWAWGTVWPGQTVIEADIQSVGVVIDEETFANLGDQFPQPLLLNHGKLVNALDVLSGSYDGVPVRNGCASTNAIATSVSSSILFEFIEQQGQDSKRAA